MLSTGSNFFVMFEHSCKFFSIVFCGVGSCILGLCSMLSWQFDNHYLLSWRSRLSGVEKVSAISGETQISSIWLEDLFLFHVSMVISWSCRRLISPMLVKYWRRDVCLWKLVQLVLLLKSLAIIIFIF